MPIFKNPNEAAYLGGKKHFTDVIKNSGHANAIIWRQPEEDFNTNSTLVVMPGEQAIFIKGGVIEQIFENGTYKLSTENYPFIGRLRNMLSGGVSAFNCVVYFVKTSHSMELLWGTSSPIQVRDKMLGVATKLRARGSYKIQISNPGIFLTKLVGNGYNYINQQEVIDDFFASEFQGKIRSNLTRYLNETTTELYGIEEHIEEIAEQIEPSISTTFEEYGLRLIKFSIASLDVLDDALRRRYDEIGMDGIAKMRNAQADKAVQQILGDEWARQQSADILKTLAANPGAGGVAAAGAGMGVGMAAGGVFSNMAQQMFTPVQQSPVQSAAPQPQPSGRFVQSEMQSKDDPIETLKKLKTMLEAGLIPQEVYDTKMKEILSRM